MLNAPEEILREIPGVISEEFSTGFARENPRGTSGFGNIFGGIPT